MPPPLAPVNLPTPWLPGAFAGVDTHTFARFQGDTKWLEKLLHLSNFSFIAHYLTHSFQGGFAGDKGKQRWKELAPALLAQEWGIWYIGVGIPQAIDLKSPKHEYLRVGWAPVSREKDLKAKMVAAERLGIDHARLLKTKFIKPLEHDIQGAIVYIDFEDALSPQPLKPEVIAYYNSWWTELRILGPENIAVRPGLYARVPEMVQFVASAVENTDLFLFSVEEPDLGQSYFGPNFEEKPGRIYSPMEFHPIRGKTYAEHKKPDIVSTTPQDLLDNSVNGRLLNEDVINSDLVDSALVAPDTKSSTTSKEADRTILLLGRQWRIRDRPDDEKGIAMPKANSRMVRLSPTRPWDFNTCMVRDPRYPIALPRIVVLDDIRIRSVFSVPVLENTGQRLPITRLEQVHSCPPQKLPFAENKDEMLEHEAPLLLLGPASKELTAKNAKEEKLVPGIGAELFTLNKNGNVVVITATGSGNPAGTTSWSNPKPIMNSAPRLRRNRAMAATKTSRHNQLETKVFYVSSDHMLIGLRRTNSASWTEDVISMEVTVHPFSNLAAVSRMKADPTAEDIIDVTFLDQMGNLAVATFKTKSWPQAELKSVLFLGTLLAGSSITGVSPSEDNSIFFFMGRDCHLYMLQHSTSGWSDVVKLNNTLKPTDDRLFPHAKMDAYSITTNNRDSVYVATLTAVNVPCMYVLTRSTGGSFFEMQERRYYHNRLHEKLVVDALVEGAPGLPDDYNDKILSPETTVAENGLKKRKRRQIDVGYAFNPFGDIKLSMVGPYLTMWIAGVTMTATPGFSGDRVVLLFTSVLPKEAYEPWKIVKA
ncbi:hypothetical protein B0J11DRAFT_512310 [Dendryphion nanum]|uniref:Uncharacterized protein n=1 Tax=Dendryphion nanum TaxID=256645 RepID=A0A9P9D1Z9_9PLEO|nr:hypothetical protein B0J11DRAFT_512310 [Dendryphion nanum]